MLVVSVINYKGGVGKTTVTANLAAELASRGYKVLMMDVDPQASLTFSFVNPEHWDRSLKDTLTIKKWFDGIVAGEAVSLADLRVVPQPVKGRITGRGELHLIPSHLALIDIDMHLATMLNGASISAMQNNYLKVHGKLSADLQKLSGLGYQIVMIDCPPNFNIVTKNAIVASDHILVPAKADYLSTLGIDYLKRNVTKLVDDYNKMAREAHNGTSEIAPQFLGVIFTMITLMNREPIQAQKQFIYQVKQVQAMPEFNTYIRNNALLGDQQSGIPLVLSANSTPVGREIIGEIKSLTDEFEQRIGLRN